MRAHFGVMKTWRTADGMRRERDLERGGIEDDAGQCGERVCYGRSEP